MKRQNLCKNRGKYSFHTFNAISTTQMNHNKLYSILLLAFCLASFVHCDQNQNAAKAAILFQNNLRPQENSPFLRRSYVLNKRETESVSVSPQIIPPVNNGTPVNNKPLNVTSDDAGSIKLTETVSTTTEKQKSVKKDLKPPLDVNVTKLDIPVTSQPIQPAVVVNDTKLVSPNVTNTTNPVDVHPPNITIDTNIKNVTTDDHEKEISKLGAKKRALIVFGTLGVLSVFYIAYKAYRKRKLRRENDGSFYQNDNQQFKYGVLLSNENDDNLELANLSLNLDSEDEDMEIFDIEQKKYLDNKSDSLVRKNLLTNKNDIEILDLDLPGTSSSLRIGNDDILLNLDDNHSHDVTVIHHTLPSNDAKSTKSSDFFDVL